MLIQIGVETMLVNKKIDMSKKITILGLTLILFIQLFACLYFGTKKEGFYEDEIATYGLSSCPNALGRNAIWGIDNGQRI